MASEEDPDVNYDEGGDEDVDTGDDAGETGGDAGEGVGGRFAGVLDKAKEVLFGDVEDGTHKPTIVNQILLAVVATLVIIGVFNMLRSIVQRLLQYNRGTPYIIKTTKDARHEMKVSQDPRVDSAIPLQRSLNEGGMEFSYMMWIFIEDYDYKKGEWKHVFHKGNVEAHPNRAPGVWLHPNDNKLRVYMNTFDQISNFVDIPNIPVTKWFHLAITLKQRTMDIYINGFLKKRVVFDAIPRQNFGPLWVNVRGGFAGLISRMRYFDYAARYTEIEHAMRVGPSFELPLSAKQKPPYFVPHWWSNDHSQ